MYNIKPSKAFLKDLNNIPSFYANDVKDFIAFLQNGEVPDEYNTHILKRDFSSVYDSHIDNDIIILWRKSRKQITLLRIGTHADLFF